MSESIHTDFLTRYQGKFRGALRWHELDLLWERVLGGELDGWYFYAVGDAPPNEPVPGEQVEKLISEIDALLRADHEEDYCGIVYADNFEHPTIIKVFDPNNLGAVCGSSGMATLPGWVISRIPPVDLPEAFPPPGNRRRWWQRIMGG